MPTLEDLHSAFTELEQRADDYALPEFTPADPKSTRQAWRARPTLSILSAAAAVFVVAVIGSAVAYQRHGQGPRPAPGFPHPTSPATLRVPTPTPGSALRAFPLKQYYFSVDPLDGYHLSAGTVFSDYQVRELRGTDGSYYNITVNAAGAWQGPQPTGAPVDISGHPGFYGVVGYQPEPTGATAGPAIGLTWMYAPNAWATVVSQDPGSIPLALAARIARAVHPGQPAMLRVPVRVPALPGGLVLQGVLCQPEGTVGRSGGQSGPKVAFDCLIDFTSAANAFDLSISVGSLVPNEAQYYHGAASTSVKGMTGWIDNTMVTLVGPDLIFGVQQQASQPSGKLILSRQQLTDIAKNLTFAPTVTQPGTWLDATSALR